MTDDGAMVPCPACSAYAASGESESYDGADGLRFSRAVLAALKGDLNADGIIAAEVGDCPACLARFTAAGLAMCTGQMLTLGMWTANAEREVTGAEPMTDDEKWAAATENAIKQMEQRVLDATDLETGL